MILTSSPPEPEQLEALTDSVQISTEVQQVAIVSRQHFDRAVAAGQSIYGTTTGYGPFVGFQAREDGGTDLIEHLLVGSGEALPPDLISPALYLRAWTMAQGRSGVRIPVIQAYLDALGICQTGMYPEIPSIGSLGASGDLIPLAHLLNAILGRGSWKGHSGKTRVANLVKGHSMDRREALACINGISFSKAGASLTYCKLNRLLRIHEILTAILYYLLDANPDHLSPTLFQSANPSNTAGRMLNYLNSINKRASQGNSGHSGAKDLQHSAEGESPRHGYALQAPYSLRCAPQTISACLGLLNSARSSIFQDLETIDDNPLIDPETGFVAHGGNFFGQSTAFGSDELTMAACQSGVLAERQLALILDPDLNGEEALMLARKPGHSSGLAGLQLTTTALVAEMRSLSQMHSTYSIPTNGKNQDIVPMAFLASRRAHQVTIHLSAVLGALLMATRNLWQMRNENEVVFDYPFWPEHRLRMLSEAIVLAGEMEYPDESLGKTLQFYQRALINREILSDENLYP
ncbi:MAG: aromatic amino acid ammonia-lyase [Leptospiraceae bacterium]